MPPQAFANWFTELDQLLADSRHLWQLQAFHQREYPWRNSHPDLAARLQALTPGELEALEASPTQLAQWLRPWLPSAERLLALAELPALPTQALSIPARLEVGIAGRKWQQICRFVEALPRQQQAPLPTLEWCAGKGHLGRLLAASGDREVTSLEWQAPLCMAGSLLARKFAARQVFRCADVLQADVAAEVGRHERAVALHACGDLHTVLMGHWVATGSRALALAPCCYHLIRSRDYQPLSDEARQAGVRLSRADLSLPLQEVVTGGAATRRLRQRQLLWRLAFDEWQREVRGVDEYLPLPGVKQSLLNAGFAEFLGWAAANKGLPAPAGPLQRWLAVAAERVERVRRVELVMHLLRRPLEVWLLLDRVLFLRQHGASVALGEFCPRQLTPRNAMILALKRI